MVWPTWPANLLRSKRNSLSIAAGPRWSSVLDSTDLLSMPAFAVSSGTYMLDNTCHSVHARLVVHVKLPCLQYRPGPSETFMYCEYRLQWHESKRQSGFDSNRFMMAFSCSHLVKHLQRRALRKQATVQGVQVWDSQLARLTSQEIE